MDYINISKRKIYIGKIHSFSSQLKETNSIYNIVSDVGFWSSEKNSFPKAEYFIIDYENPVFINFIELLFSPNKFEFFPKDFRIESSLDLDTWEVLYNERNLEIEAPSYILDVPLTRTRYLKIYVASPRMTEPPFFSEIGKCQAGIKGIQSIRATSCSSPECDVSNVLDDKPSKIWKSDEKSNSTRESIHVDLGNIFHINRLSFGTADELFPDTLFIETSPDDTIWSPLLEEKNFIAEPHTRYFWNIDITPVRYIRIDVRTVSKNDSYSAKISSIDIDAAPFNPFHTHNIGELTPYASVFQAGIVKLSRDGEDIPGTAVQASDRRLRDATTIFKGIVQLSEDGDDSKGLAVQSSDSRLKPATDIRPGIVRLAYDRETKSGTAVQGNDSRLREADEKNFGIVKLCPNGEYREGSVITGNDSRIQKATAKSFGICRLADDGSVEPLTAVQGSDRRLRDSTTTAKGIVELAEDGEDAPDRAVQGNDKRLKDATTLSKGIVELAENGENAPNRAVQGNDRRLKDATTLSKGIVELAEDGEDEDGVAVQGSDRRLKDATTTAKGIVELAEDGEDAPNVAVQGNDRRLKDASETTNGILRFASDGEDFPFTAVQGNDRRLKDATTTAKGIVELAEDGETGDGVVVQGSDSRLKKASGENPGIVQFSRNGESRNGYAVQSTDSRLSDRREPAPHEHDYAPVSHEHNSHTGSITIELPRNEIFNEITPPSGRSAVITGKNTSEENGSIGIAGISTASQAQSYGVAGHSTFVGIRGQSSGTPGRESGKGCGVLGVSRFGAGGVFSSEHGFSLIADGYGKIHDYDHSLNLLGSGDALLVRGRSEFTGPLSIQNDEGNREFSANIVEMFEVEESEYISPGDLLAVSTSGNSILSRSRTAYNRSVVGVVSGNPTLVLNNSGSETKIYPVSLAGKTMCKVDARENPINPGDLIVTSNTPGCGMSGKIDSFDRLGTVIGKALDRLEEGIGLIPVFIMHQ